MTATAATLANPAWPARPFEPARANVHYNPPADEVVVYFGDRPVPAVSIDIADPGPDTIYLKVDEATGTVVGIHVSPVVGRGPDLPAAWWGLLYEDGPARRAAVAALVADARGLFERYGLGR